MQNSESYFKNLIENVNDIIAIFEQDGTTLYGSPSLERVLGHKPGDSYKLNTTELIHPKDRKSVIRNFLKSFKTPDVSFSITARFRHREGNWCLLEAIGSTSVSDEGYARCIVNARDITERSHLSRKLSHQASHDKLTGLINRHEFERRLDHVVNACRIENTESALCYLDLDQFKIINDTCGHVAGDELLKQISALLRKCIWKRDTLARLGGDEYGILLEHCTSKQADKAVKKILSRLGDFRFIWENNNFSISLSIGLVQISANSDSSIDILKQADAACFAAKEAGRNRVHTFRHNDEVLARRHGQMQWVTQISQAVDENRFCSYAQPIVAVASDDQEDKEHYELLLRMRGSEGQLIAPGLFLPAAERYNLSQRLDCWVIDNAFSWLINNPTRLARLSRCAINLSGLSLGNKNFLAHLVSRLEKSNIPFEKICFEITETATIANLSVARYFIDSLREMGCLFALDDFGSGLSSFAYLKSLPVDYLKIDGLFVKDMDTNPINFAMVKSINEIGKVMGLKTIAEFVENADILSGLEEIGVDYAQGYYIDKPKPLD